MANNDATSPYYSISLEQCRNLLPQLRSMAANIHNLHSNLVRCELCNISPQELFHHRLCGPHARGGQERIREVLEISEKLSLVIRIISDRLNAAATASQDFERGDNQEDLIGNLAGVATSTNATVSSKILSFKERLRCQQPKSHDKIFSRFGKKCYCAAGRFKRLNVNSKKRIRCNQPQKHDIIFSRYGKRCYCAAVRYKILNVDIEDRKRCYYPLRHDKLFGRYGKMCYCAVRRCNKLKGKPDVPQ